MFSQPDLSVIVVSYNTREVLRACLQQLYKASAGLSMEVIVVDNASRDQSAEMVSQDFPQVRLIASQVNLGFASGNNVGFDIALGRYVVLLNPDALVDGDALRNALQHMEDTPRAAMGGARLLGGDGSLQPSARLFPSLLNELLSITGLAYRFPKSRFFGRFDRTWDDQQNATQVDWVPGAFAIIRQSALKKMGGFDERFFLYYEEVDLCRRLHAAGWEIWYWPDIVVRHSGGESSKTVKHLDFSSSGSQLTLWRMRSGLLYYRKHHGIVTTWLVSRLESAWHQMRMLRARCMGNLPKQDESRRFFNLMRQAWQETLGGQISPRRPW